MIAGHVTLKLSSFYFNSNGKGVRNDFSQRGQVLLKNWNIGLNKVNTYFEMLKFFFLRKLCKGISQVHVSKSYRLETNSVDKLIYDS